MSAPLNSPLPRQIPLWVWALPPLLLIASAPLWLHWYEPAMFLAINQACMGIAAPAWTGLSMLGNAWAILGLTAPLIVLAPRLLWAWLCAAPFAILFARGGKALLESPRPAAEIDNTQMRIVGEVLHNVSMPSGHTLTAFAVASGIYFALPPARRLHHAWLFVLAAGAGLSRIAVGAHWPGDVAVGAALGLLSGMLGQMLLVRMGPAHQLPTAWSLRVVALLLLLAVYHLLAEELDFAENLPFQGALALVAVVSLAVFGWRSFGKLKRQRT
ncbi:MAG: PA-phosphatase [Burkholderiales bacterium PBB3]|nr:MAG: PA-phosphatase [Burkholderiales bacterium PBB3]